MGLWILSSSSKFDDSNIEDMLFHNDDMEHLLLHLMGKFKTGKRKRGGSTVGRLCIPCNRALSHEMLMEDYFAEYTPAIDFWSLGCIFAEMLTGRPLFPGKNVVHQLDLMTDLLGTPSAESISKIRNEKARRYLGNMKKKHPIPFSQKFPGVDPMALHLLERLLAFHPMDRPTAAEALADPYFNGLANSEREPTTQPISKLEFEFERRKLAKEDVRELIYREILEYHPQMLHEYLPGGDQANFLYPSGVDRFKRQFVQLEEVGAKGEKTSPQLRQHASLPRERVIGTSDGLEKPNADYCIKLHASELAGHTSVTDGISKPLLNGRNLLKSESIGASKCVVVKQKREKDEVSVAQYMHEASDE